MKYIVIALSVCFIASCDKKQTSTKDDSVLKISQTNRDSYKPKNGIIVGKWDDIEGVGVYHRLGNKGTKFKLMNSVDSIFQCQAKAKIIIPERMTDKMQLSRHYKINKPARWLSKAILERHRHVIALDLRPHDPDYMAHLNSIFTMYDRCLAEKMIKKTGSRDGLPIYEVSPEFKFKLNKSQIIVLENENTFHTNICGVVQSHDNGRNYLAFLGSAHIYRAWLDGCIKNVYFAMDEGEIEMVAKVTAFQNHITKSLVRD